MPATKAPSTSRLCYPLAWSGVVPGVTERRDVVALHGPGVEVDGVGHLGGLAYTDKRRWLTMLVGIGTDSVVESIAVTVGSEPPPGATSKPLPASSRIDAVGRFGPGLAIALGGPASRLLGDLGPPHRREDRSDGTEAWEYETDDGPTECYAQARLTAVVRSGVIVAVELYTGE